jgi:CheY-like chemotaxis protein
MGRERNWQAMPKGSGGSEPLRVLVLEDEPIVALELETFLHELGAEVVASAGATEAALRVALATPVDAALLDIQIGNGFGGIDLARQLKTLGIAIIFVTGLGTELESRAEMRGLHPYAVFAKPYPPLGLTRTLRRLARERGKSLRLADEPTSGVLGPG